MTTLKDLEKTIGKKLQKKDNYVSVYDTNEVDNLYKIVDKLVELKNDPFKFVDWDIKFNYVLSEIQTYNRYVDYPKLREDFKKQGLELK